VLLARFVIDCRLTLATKGHVLQLLQSEGGSSAIFIDTQEAKLRGVAVPALLDE
jgi:hypothetical protein